MDQIQDNLDYFKLYIEEINKIMVVIIKDEQELSSYEIQTFVVKIILQFQIFVMYTRTNRHLTRSTMKIIMEILEEAKYIRFN